MQHSALKKEESENCLFSLTTLSMENDDNKPHLIPKSVETDDEHSLVLELPKNDPLFEKKKKLLQAVGFDSKGQGRVYFKSSASADLLNSILESMLQRARIINLNEVDLYFVGGDTIGALGFFNPRNELDALHSIFSLIDSSISSNESTKISELLYLRNATIDMIQEIGNQISEDTKIISNCSSEKEKFLLQWGESNGVLTKLDIAHVEGAGRGAIAKEDLKVGDVAMEIPVSVIIFEEFVHESDMFPILEKIDGISSETMMLLWSMKEKYNPNSKFKPYFDTLPKCFHTGLSFGIDAIMALDGTLLLEEIIQAKEHLRSQYDEMFPLLSNDYPHVFPPELYTWERFLWACELWYSNSMKVMFVDGKLRTCLIPIAGFLNHSICPHIMHYGKVDSTTNSLKFRVSRPCNEGEQCYLSYGNLSSSHLLTFYGFLPKGDNPCDVIPLDIDVMNADGSDDECQKDSDRTADMVRGTWFSKNHGIFHYGLPPHLLDNLRRARNPMLQTNTLTQENLEIDLEVLEDLRSTFEDMLQILGDAQSEDREHMNWDVKLALDFKDVQKKIISSIVSSCYSGSSLVHHQLSNFI